MERKLGARGGRFGRDNGPLRRITFHTHQYTDDGQQTIYASDLLVCGHTVKAACSGRFHILARRCGACRASELAEAVLT